MVNKKDLEKGQALVFIVIALVGLLGFTALAIDGGMAFSNRRHAQNSADAAALAGALQKANNRSNADIQQAILNSTGSNDFQSDQVTWSTTGPFQDFFGKYYLVSVTIVSPVETSLIQFVYPGSLQNTVNAIARAYISQPALPGNAIIAMGDCTDEGGNQITISGGGSGGGVETFNGGIFVNVPERGSDHCAIDPPSASGPIGIVAHDGFNISSVGSYDYNGAENMSPLPIDTGINSGARVLDPLEDVPEPVCTSNGSVSGGVYQPGRYGGAGQPSIGGGTYSSGIYCISGDIHLSGSGVIQGDGVLLYMVNGGASFTGNAGMQISAPTSSNCLGTAGDPTSSCTYVGMAIFMARINTSTFEVRGNGGDAIHGLIYALQGTIQARGGGADPSETSIVGQIIARRVFGDGNGSFSVTYDEDQVYHKAPTLALDK